MNEFAKPCILSLVGLAVLIATPTYTRADSGRAFTAAGPNRLCTPGEQLCVRGQLDPTGTRLTGSVAIETKLGDWVLDNAALEIDRTRPSLRGTATLGMPQLGLLAAATSSKAVASVYVGFGSDSELQLANRPFKPSGNKFYIAAELGGAASVTLGGATVFELRKGTSLLFEPTTPMIYADGLFATALASMLRLGAIEAFGLSLDDRACIPHTTANPLLPASGGTPARRTVCGNVLVAGSLTYKLFTASGELLVDLDANGNGKTVFEGEPRDFTIVADTTGSISIPKLKAPIELARTSLVYEAAIGETGRLGAATAQGRDVAFGGSPLGRVLGGSTVRTYVLADDTRQLARFEADQAVLGGFQVAALTSDVKVTGNDAIYELRGKVALPVGGQVSVNGTVATDGSFRLTATQKIAVRGLELQKAFITLSNEGVALSGEARARGADLEIDATLATRRDPNTVGEAQPVGPDAFALAGAGRIELRGRKLGDGRLIATAKELRAKGTLKYAGTTFKLEGTINSARTFELSSSIKVSGEKRVDFGVKTLTVRADGKVTLRISDESYGATFRGDLDPGGSEKLSVNGDGEICPQIKVTILGQNIGKKVCINLL